MVESRTAELELDNQLCFALYDASRAVIRAYGPLLGDIGLSYPQYLVMLVLWPAEGPLAVGELGALLHLDSGTLTPLLKRLAQRGLVNRRRDPEDERRVLITLSPAGRDLRARAAAVPIQIFDRFGLDVETARLLRDQLTQIVRTLQPTSGPPARPGLAYDAPALAG